MADSPKIVRARHDAELARERLLRSAHALQTRVSPSRIANDALEDARERGVAALDAATTVARERPALVAGVAVGLVALLVRRPIVRLFRRPKQPTLAGPARHALPRPSGDRT